MTENNLTGTVALVTGASRGIGREISLMLGRLGAKVVLVARDKVALDKVCRQIIAGGGQAQVAVVDLESEKSILQLVQTIKPIVAYNKQKM